ncbi:hypothetical protein RIF29_29342 [Crotalaria pallida]|uniref:Protein FAR1-RELATED SEQUENCE n=1 Tax=Crotalaria pallida TaxID=3830 RepID=A0AAN9EEF4_CROPI
MWIFNSCQASLLLHPLFSSFIASTSQASPTLEGSSKYQESVSIDHINNVETTTAIEIDIDDENDDCLRWQPKSGMCFSSLEELKSFYSEYASRVGFGWKIRTSRKSEDGIVYYMIIACSREGSHVSSIPSTLKTVPTKAKGCPTKITTKLEEDGLWYLKKVDLEHNHEVNPTKARKFRNNKKISMNVQRTIQINDDAGVRINKTFRALVEEAGGHANLACDERDVRNFIQKERRAIGKDGDGAALNSYFNRMRDENANFFYDIDLDDGFHVKNMFWADARSRATYDSLGDVITFNTTYLTNKYDMPFAAFVGINHHGQSVLLGCGLVSNEDTSSFAWLFSSWLRCMSGKPPGGIVTDQCKAMQNAIELVFPTTHHRWCLWHIMKKIPEKLKGFGEYKKMKNAMKAAVYDTLMEAEFEEEWLKFIDVYHLRDNEWLSGLFAERHRWVPIYLKRYFWGGMSTTQRSEGIHAFFDGYINSTTSLRQFVKQYDNALRDKAEKEFDADFRSMDTIIPCGSSSPIEKQFQQEYTHAKFVEVQSEFRGKMNCAALLKSFDGTIATYEVFEEMTVGDKTRNQILDVAFNRDNHDISCQCFLFEFRGIMCRHSLSVLSLERVERVSSKYILTRWSKNKKWKHSYIKTSYDVPTMKPSMERYDKLCKHFHEVGELAAEFEDESELLHQTLDNLKHDMLSMRHSKRNVETSFKGDYHHEKYGQHAENPIPHIRSPLRVKRKGRPPSNKKMPTVEKVVRKIQKRTKQGDQNLIIEVVADPSTRQS